MFQGLGVLAVLGVLGVGRDDGFTVWDSGFWGSAHKDLPNSQH